MRNKINDCIIIIVIQNNCLISMFHLCDLNSGRLDLIMAFNSFPLVMVCCGDLPNNDVFSLLVFFNLLSVSAFADFG